MHKKRAIYVVSLVLILIAISISLIWLYGQNNSIQTDEEYSDFTDSITGDAIQGSGSNCFFPQKGLLTTAKTFEFLASKKFAKDDYSYQHGMSAMNINYIEKMLAEKYSISPKERQYLFEPMSREEKNEAFVLMYLSDKFAKSLSNVPKTGIKSNFYEVQHVDVLSDSQIKLHIATPTTDLGRAELYSDFLDAAKILKDKYGVDLDFKVTLVQRALGEPGISSQAGKFVTIYPKDPLEAKTIAEYLNKVLSGNTYGNGEPIVSFGDVRFSPNSYVSWRVELADDGSKEVRQDPLINLQKAANDPNIKMQDGMSYWFSNAMNNGIVIPGAIRDTPTLTLEQKAKEISSVNSVNVEKEVQDFILAGDKLPTLTQTEKNNLIEDVKYKVYIYDENGVGLIKYSELDDAIAGNVLDITPERAQQVKNIIDGLFNPLSQRDLTIYEQEVLQYMRDEYELDGSNLKIDLSVSLSTLAEPHVHIPSALGQSNIFLPVKLRAFPSVGDSPFLEQLLHEGGHASDWIKKSIEGASIPETVGSYSGIDNVHLIFYQEIRQLLREKNGNLLDAFDRYSSTYGPKNPSVSSGSNIDHMTPIMDLAITSGKGNWDLYQIMEFDNLLVQYYSDTKFYSIDTSSNQFKEIVDTVNQLNPDHISLEKAKNIVEKEVISNGRFVKESDKPTQYIDPKTNRPYIDAKTGLVAPYYTGYMTGENGVKVKVFIKAQHGSEVPATAAVSYKFAEKFFEGSNVLALPQIRRSVLINGVQTDCVISPWKDGMTDSMDIVNRVSPSDASLIRTFYMATGDPAHSTGSINSMNLFALKDTDGVVYGVVTDLNGGLNVISDIKSLPGIYNDFESIDGGRISQDSYNRLSQFDRSTIDSIVHSENYDFTFPGIADLSITDEVIASFVDRVNQLKATYDSNNAQSPIDQVTTIRPQDVKLPAIEYETISASKEAFDFLSTRFGGYAKSVVDIFAKDSKSKYVESISKEEVISTADKIVNKYTLTFRGEKPVVFYTKYDKFASGDEGYFTYIANTLGLAPEARIIRDSASSELTLTKESEGIAFDDFAGTDAQLGSYLEQYGIELARLHFEGGIVHGDLITPNSELSVNTQLHSDNNRVFNGKPTFIDFELSSVATKGKIEKEFNQVKKAIENEFGVEVADKFAIKYQNERAKYAGKTSTLADELVAKRIELTFENRMDTNVKFVSGGKYSSSNIEWYNYDVPSLLKYADPNYVLIPKDSRVLEYNLWVRETGKDYSDKLTFYAKRRTDPRVQTNSLYTENLITQKAYLAGVGPNSRIERINFNEGVEEEVLITSDIKGESIYDSITRLKNANDKPGMLKFIGDYGYALGKLRKAGIIHRDLVHAVDANARSLHMGNAFVTSEGTKFIDFGQSTLAEVGDSSFEFERTDLITAMQSAFVGTGLTVNQIRDVFNLRYSEGYSGTVSVPKTESKDTQNSKQLASQVVPGSNFEGYVGKVISIDTSVPPVISVQKVLKELNIDTKKYYYIRGVAPEEAIGALSLSNDRTVGTGVFNSRDVRPAFGLNTRDKPGIDLVNLNTFLTESGPIARAADYANIGAFVENYVNYYGVMPDPALLSAAPTPGYTGYFLVFATDKPLPQDMETAIRPGVIIHYGSPDKVNIVRLPEGIEEKLVSVIPAFPMQPFKPLPYKAGQKAMNIVQKIDPCSGSFGLSLSPGVGPCKVTLGKSNQLFLAQYDAAISNKDPIGYSIDDPRTLSGFLVNQPGVEYDFVFTKGAPDFSSGQKNINPFGLAHYKKHILPSQHTGYLSDLMDINLPSSQVSSSLMLQVSLDSNGLLVLTANSPDEVMNTFDNVLSNGQLSPLVDSKTGKLVTSYNVDEDVSNFFRILKTDSANKKLITYTDFQFLKSDDHEYIFVTAYPTENPLTIFKKQFPTSVINYYKYNSASGRYELKQAASDSVLDQIYESIRRGKYRYSSDASGKTIIKPIDREFWSFLSLTKLI